MDNEDSSLYALAALRAKQSGLLDGKSIKETKIDPKVSARIAEAFEKMQHTPNDPKTKKSYEALIREVEKQYSDMIDDGFKVSKMTEGMDNPYKKSADLVKDVKDNKHMWYYPTEQGFGSGANISDNPMLQPTKHLDADGKPMLANDLFRVVHDNQGHAKEGHKFGATGEERAYLEHKKSLSKEAQKALATETRGQNSWVNYGPMGEANRKNPANTVYADQKAGLLPDWALKEVDELSNPLKHHATKAGKMAIKAGLPAMALAGASSADSIDQAIMDTIIPGGVSEVGDPMEDRMMMNEVDARKNYDKSQARMDALKKLMEKE